MDNVIDFTVYGKVRGQGRPRAVSKGSFASVYKAKEDRLYEAFIREAYLQRYKGVAPFGEVPLVLDLTAYLPIPKYFSKKLRALAIAGRVVPTVKPDFDNIEKSVADALGGGVAYPDDKFIVRNRTAKCYGEMPKLVIRLYEFKPGDGE